MSVRFLLLILSITSVVAPTQAEITTATLIEEMLDLDRLSLFPEPAYKVVQFSSYDRTSQAPYTQDWYANSDGFGGEPVPNFLEVVGEPGADGVGKYLLAAVDGPGAVVRCWTARIAGDLEVYLDGSPDPIYRGPAEPFLQRTLTSLAEAGGIPGFERNRRYNQREAHYFPIPFQKGLRIIWMGNLKDTHFYQLEVRKYPEGTQVRTFSPKDLETYEEIIHRTGVALRGNRVDAPADGSRVDFRSITLPPGETRELLNQEGMASVRTLRLKVDAPAEAHALRKTILSGYFDRSHRPQIDAPVGDFFGSTPMLTPYRSVPMCVYETGWMVCEFPIPWKSRGVFTLTNRSDQPVSVLSEIETMPYEWDDERSMHFHAKWRVDHDLSAGENAGVFDLPYLAARGKGVFVGASLSVLNPSSVPTSGGNWWGEGDEKIWIDDDEFPSLFGTGSEDYFNYAWSSPDLFQHPYFAQPYVTGPDNRGFNTNIRWHILDPLPFQNRIDFYMELFTHTRTDGISYARTAYYYAMPNIRDDAAPITGLAIKKGLKLPENWTPSGRGQAEGAVFLQAEDLVLEGKGVDIESASHWAGGKIVRWNPDQVGDQLVLKFNVEDGGKYQPVATFAYGPTSGRVSAQLNGKPLKARTSDPRNDGRRTDLFTPHQEMSRNVWFEADGGNLDLSPGEHTLTLTSEELPMDRLGDEVGLDFIWLKPR